MTILRQILETRSVRVYLNFGINEDIRFHKIDPRIKMGNDGQPSSKHCTMTFSKVDENGNVKASSNFDFFNLDPTKGDYVVSNFSDEFSTMTSILLLYLTAEEVDEKFKALEEQFSSLEELEKELKTKKGALKLQDLLADCFAEAVTPFIGIDSAPLRVKVITDKTGKYLQMPNGNFIEPMTIAKEDSSLKLTLKEIKASQAASKPQVKAPTKTGEAPAQSAADALDDL
jgi:hypothetical protein